MDGSLVEEIRVAIRGRGVFDHGSVVDSGSHLGRLCAIDESDGVAERAGKLVVGLRELAEGLPDDLRLAFLTAAGLHEEARHRYLKERTRWLAERIDRTFRTAQRLVVDSVERIAALAEGGGEHNPFAPAGWSLRSMRTSVRLRAAPRITEEREIVSVRDGLREIIVSMAVPRHPAGGRAPEPDFEILQGGRLVAAERPGESYFRYRIGLPAPLGRGERHLVGVRHHFPEAVSMVPRYTYRPVRPCESLTVTVQFSPERPPSGAWCIPGLPHGMVDDSAGERDSLQINELAEARVEFSRPRPGLAYGVRWLESTFRGHLSQGRP